MVPGDEAEKQVASSSFHGPVAVSVVADDALFVPAGSRSPVVVRDHQRLEMVVVVGEIRNLESTVVTEEVSPLAARYRVQVVAFDQCNGIVVHIDAFLSQLVLVNGVDTKQLRALHC